MRITMVGLGYVGLVTAASLAEIGHHVTCVDQDENKVRQLKEGILPFYEPGLRELITNLTSKSSLTFTTSLERSCLGAEVIYIAVGTPPNDDGTVDLSSLETVALQLAGYIKADVIVVIKSTVPVGTNDYVKRLIDEHLPTPVSVDIVSNPEFLREGTALHDTFFGDRIVIGANNPDAAKVIEEINKPFNVPIVKTTLQNAEMIKYASNAFLATKISFINEIANICEKVGADIADVAKAMGMDKRIGPQFLQAGIGYGGSCFPKDTRALMQISGNVAHEFALLKAVIDVNNKQQTLLVEKAKQRFGKLDERRIAVLGLAFKPNTDDIREAASLVVIEQLLTEGATVTVYDPVAMNNAKLVLNDQVLYAESVEAALKEADMALIVTEWEIIKQADLPKWRNLMNEPIIFDGRNCFDPSKMAEHNIEYHSIGRPVSMHLN
ncbi:UDP-glucose dehydrogenase family protein [Aquibacillus salsiterrae]|uniref:UDP-glucose 6-dehydrogenase n=1 Tax=Aquibacillus salsiterrae TaxID=2950439 RepID=A0A9X3WAR3_9BACI|nr:UDP-glucose/GDP-mannose dehydrogenase family protein [Aquibacillus salsiterrae]MDC3415865.1 UDP-glucose/GDP-mannose dehydrogenase family protein [Aquibacillus salsiterrae]